MFKIDNLNNFVKFEILEFNSECQEFKFLVNIECGNFIIKDKIIYTYKQEFVNFYNLLQQCYDKVAGEVISKFEYEEDIKLKLSFTSNGNVIVNCEIFEYGINKCKCFIEFETDQTFIKSSLEQMKTLLNKN